MTFNLLKAAAVSTALLAAAPASAVTTINFETNDSGNAPSVGSALGNTAYDGLGLTFTNAFFRRCGGGCPAPNNGIFISSDNFANAFTVNFARAISNFTFQNVSNSGSIARAFDANGNLLATVNFSGFPGSFALNVAGIRSVTFGNGSGQFGVDNFGYEGSAIAGVPEPATWAFMILGFGLIGGALRSRRRTQVRFAAA